MSESKRGNLLNWRKLLNKTLLHQRKNNESKVELINTEGQTFSLTTTAPDKENKITNARKWEKAFRIYAMIYATANPGRSAEIMQYIDDIQQASSSFLWENVAVYDYMFRKLMEKNPHRSWAVTNSHMWTMYLKDHIPKGGVTGAVGSSSAKKDWRDIACWRYNKNKCNRSAGECRYEHRCSYCGSFSHIYYSCPKKGNKKGEGKDKDKTAGAGGGAPPAPQTESPA